MLKLVLLLLLGGCVGEITNDADECFYHFYLDINEKCDKVNLIK